MSLRKRRLDPDLRRIVERETTLAALKEMYDKAGIKEEGEEGDMGSANGTPDP